MTDQPKSKLIRSEESFNLARMGIEAESEKLHGADLRYRMKFDLERRRALRRLRSELREEVQTETNDYDIPLRRIWEERHQEARRREARAPWCMNGRRRE